MTSRIGVHMTSRIGVSALHIDMCAPFCYDQIDLETVNNQNKDIPILFPNRISSYIKYHATQVIWCKVFAVLPGRMATYLCMFNTFLGILIVYPVDIHMAESSADVISWMHSCPTKKCFAFYVLCKGVFNPLDTEWRCCNLTSTRTFPPFGCHHPPNSFHQHQPCRQTTQ